MCSFLALISQDCGEARSAIRIPGPLRLCRPSFFYQGRIANWQCQLSMRPCRRYPTWQSFRENQTCTKSWSPFWAAFAPLCPRGVDPLVFRCWKPRFLWEVIVFLQNVCMNALFSPIRKWRAKGNVKWWPSNRCVFVSR